MPDIAPYGSWRSAITPDALTASAIGISSPVLDGDRIYWNERRPADAGRQVIVERSPDGTTHDVIGAPFSARTRVHEYGGASYLVKGGVCWFVNEADQRVWRVVPGSSPTPITPESSEDDQVRYADLELHPDGDALYAIRERHLESGEVVNDLVVLDPSTDSTPRVIAAGHDFFAAPRCSPDGRRLVYLSWDHPDMPWDATTLHEASIAADHAAIESRKLAGGGDISISQPRFKLDGTCCFLSDRDGFWVPYDEFGNMLSGSDADHCAPDWVLGQQSFAFNDAGRLFVIRHDVDGEHLYRVDGGGRVAIAPDLKAFGALVAGGGALFAVAGSPTMPIALWSIDQESGAAEVLRTSRVPQHSVAISEPMPITFVGGDGLDSHAWFYPPRNAEFVAPDGELPPLIVLSHGGPTSQSAAIYDVGKQFFTSRGIAVVDVNYGGSSGYGRSYRNRLRGEWGVLDVADCVAAALHLAIAGLVDKGRLIIRGGSAGGFTTLAALATTQVFAAGSSHYGVSDLKSLATDTHKFESRYLDRLIGPWPAAEATYNERSPLEHADQINCPVIFFQGLDDRIVPPDQAERIVAALRSRGIPVAYLAFEGESHGFRRAETIRAVAGAELAFFGRVLEFVPDVSSDLVIENEAALAG